MAAAAAVGQSVADDDAGARTTTGKRPFSMSPCMSRRRLGRSTRIARRVLEHTWKIIHVCNESSSNKNNNNIGMNDQELTLYAHTFFFLINITDHTR